MPETNDEISLRDLYLILRRGLPLIVGVSLVAAVAAFFVTSFLPKTYRAEATVLISPSPVRVPDNDAIGFAPRSDVSFEAYETIALSSAVLEAALERVPGIGLTRQQLRGSVELTQLIGPQRPDQIAPQTVSHIVTSSDPDQAAALATAWATASVQSVQRSLQASFTPVQNTTLERLGALLSDLDEAELELEAFQARDTGSLLALQLEDLNTRITSRRERLDTIALNLATFEAQRRALSAQLEAADGTATPIAAQLPLLNAEELIPPELAEQIEALVSAQPAATGTLEADLIRLQARSRLQTVVVNVASLLTEQAFTEQQLEDFERRATDLRAASARLRLERTQLNRNVDDLRNAYDAVAHLEPTVLLLTALAPTSTQVLNQASAPTEPSGPRRSLTTALTLVLVGMLVTLYVFLREAVRPPPAPPPMADAPTVITDPPFRS